MGVLLQLSHDEKDIQFLNREHGIIGFTTYTEEIWDKLSKVNWYVDEKKLLEGKKTYIYTGSNAFGSRKDLHQIVMTLWYGKEKIEEAYEKNFIVEHHDNDAFNCCISNLSFASNDLNLTKAHSFDKNQPKLTPQVAVAFYKNFKTQKYQITILFMELYYLIIDEKKTALERLYLVYDDNFRVVYTDANRIVDELLESKRINFKLLSYKALYYIEAIGFISENGEKVSGIHYMQDSNGNVVMVVGDDTTIIFDSIAPLEDLYEK